MKPEPARKATLDDLARLVSICDDLGRTPTVVHFEPSLTGIKAWMATRTDAEHVADALNVKLMENEMRRRTNYRDYSAETGPFLIQAASFDHHDDWEGRS